MAHDDSDDRPREHAHQTTGSSGTGFKFTTGLLAALAIFFVGLPLLAVGGWALGFFAVTESAREAETDPRLAEAKRAADEAAAREQAAATKPLAAGDQVVLVAPNDSIPVGTTEQDLEAYARAAEAKDRAKMADLTRAGRVVRVAHGTDATVTAVEGGAVKVAIAGGPSDGTAGYVAPRHVKRLFGKK
jgi:hypothetical protein